MDELLSKGLARAKQVSITYDPITSVFSAQD
jgi:hypothetical protein